MTFKEFFQQLFSGKCIRKCSYCHTKLLLKVRDAKKPVPSGAKDLGETQRQARIYCPKCNWEEDHWDVYSYKMEEGEYAYIFPN